MVLDAPPVAPFAEEVAPDEPLRLPSPPAEGPAPSFAWISALAPIAGALVLWLVTRSPSALWFAALGPVLAVATLLDGRRGMRRRRRREKREVTVRVAAVRAAIVERHDGERRARWSRHPDVARHLMHPEETWRSVPGRSEHVVVGSGAGRSALRVDGGDDSPASSAVRREAAVIEAVPITVPLTAGIAVIGPRVIADAVARALVLQVCLAVPPQSLRVTGDVDGWDAGLPHREATAPAELHIAGPGAALPGAVGAVVAVVDAGSPAPPRCAAVLTLESPTRARLDHDGRTRTVRVEAIDRAQAAEIVRVLVRRASVLRGGVDGPPPSLGALLHAAPPPGCDALPAVIGARAGAAATVDLVRDGPHAVVIGITGSGKSELLTTWVVSLATGRTPQEVAFLLVDFKGGRAFDALRALPHVTGVVTDLDEQTTLRAIQSLRAEIRHRETVMAAAGFRDIAEAGGALARLVVVVDEYAALVAAHPALHDLFGDLAARGRALGIHLILASQRASGVFRDAVLANAPLRLALRVADPADSRTVLGVDDAAALSGRPDDRGLCLVRGAADDEPRRVRVVRATSAEIAPLIDGGGEPARPPWLPPLPDRIALELLRSGRPGSLVIGLADEPDRQRQAPVALAADDPGLLVLGAAGSGRSTVLRALAAQADDVVVVPAQAEAGWDAVARAERSPRGALVIVDDLDLLLARLTHEHATVVRDRLERLAREARARGIRLAVSAQRAGGALARVADALPRRLLLAHASRGDLVAAGGEAADFGRLPAGRGHLDGTLVQCAWTPPGAALPADADLPFWYPGRHPVALVIPGGPRCRAVVERWRAAGVDIQPVDTPAPAGWAAGTVRVGTPEAWLGQWRLLAAARAEAHLVVDAACAAEYRAVTGSAELPPYAVPGEGRAWLHAPGGTVTRIALPR